MATAELVKGTSSQMSPADGAANRRTPLSSMRRIALEKVTLNFGAGANQARLDVGIKLITLVGGKAPVKTVAHARIPAWNIRPGLPIGCKLTLRGKAADELLRRLLQAVDALLSSDCFDDQGNFSFGIKEYINVPGVKYDPEIGILGFDVAVTLIRPGYRVARRAVLPHKLSHKQRISKDEARSFVVQHYGVTIRGGHGGEQ